MYSLSQVLSDNETLFIAHIIDDLSRDKPVSSITAADMLAWKSNQGSSPFWAGVGSFFGSIFGFLFGSAACVGSNFMQSVAGGFLGSLLGDAVDAIVNGGEKDGQISDIRDAEDELSSASSSSVILGIVFFVHEHSCVQFGCFQTRYIHTSLQKLPKWQNITSCFRNTLGHSSQKRYSQPGTINF